MCDRVLECLEPWTIGAGHSTLGDVVRVSDDADRWQGATGTIAHPSKALARGRQEHGGLDCETARNCVREGESLRLRLVEFDDPKPERSETQEGYSQTTGRRSTSVCSKESAARA